MSKLKISGLVLYNDLHTPVPNARVQIYDVDTGGNGTDKILDKRTGTDGKFTGISSEWSDANYLSTFVGNVPVPDMLILEFRVTENTKVHRGPFIHIGDYNSAPIIVPWGPGGLNAQQRELIHLITLSDQMPPDDRLLYQIIEFASSATTRTLLGAHYRSIHVLEGSRATLQGFRDKLEQVSSQASTRAVDVIFSTHGSDGSIHFYPDTTTNMSTVVQSLNTIPQACRRKFRMLFSTACFGKTHIQSWASIGFNALWVGRHLR